MLPLAEVWVQTNPQAYQELAQRYIAGLKEL